MLYLIGGGDIGKGNTLYETEVIDKDIVLSTNKTNPNFLFIGLASNFSESYYSIIKKIYQDLGCSTSNLKMKNIINNPSLVEDKINRADIIYIGGGDTVKLLDVVKEYNIDKLLFNALKSNKIIAGISAGAILLCHDGFSDAYMLRGESNKYQFINGLNFTNISISPHFHSYKDKDLELKSDLLGSRKIVYGIENSAALKIDNGNMSIIEDSHSNVYKVYYDKDTYREIKL